MCLWFIPKWLEWPHPQLVRWWLLVHSNLAGAHHDATPMSPPLQHNSPNHLNRILQHWSFFFIYKQKPEYNKKRKRKRVRIPHPTMKAGGF
jgi:hypothetical protein